MAALDRWQDRFLDKDYGSNLELLMEVRRRIHVAGIVQGV